MKKKICIFSGFFPLTQGGAEYQAYLIAELLKKLKYDVFFISFNQSNKSIIHKNGYRIYNIVTNKHLAIFGKPYFFYYYKIKHILTKERPNVVYRRMGSSIIGMLGILKRQLNFKLIWACAHINNLKKFKAYRTRIFNIFDDILRIYGIKKADIILVQTNEQKKILFANFQKDSFVVPNFHPLPLYNNKIIKKEKPIKILWIANFKKWKQPELFVELAYRFRVKLDVQFIMIGRSGSGEFLIKMKKKINKLNRFEYKGELPIGVVNRILEESHIYINTSLYEGFPNTFIQAWMRKVPVVSLNIDPDNIIKANSIGFHSKTFEQLVEDTKTLIENPKIRTKMGEMAQNFAIKNFTIKKNTNVLIDHIESKIGFYE